MFSELRTKDQLGYIVSFGQANYGRYPDIQRGFLVRVLSKKFDPVYCESRLNAFLLKHYDFINIELTQANVTSIGDSIIQSLIEPPKSYLEEASTYYDAIIYDKPWNLAEIVSEEIKTITLSDVQEYCNTYLFDKYKTRTSLSIMLFGGVNSANTTIVTDKDNIAESEKAFNYIMKEKRVSVSKILKHVYDIDVKTDDVLDSAGSAESNTAATKKYVPLKEVSDEETNRVYLTLDEVAVLRSQLPFLE